MKMKQVNIMVSMRRCLTGLFSLLLLSPLFAIAQDSTKTEAAEKKPPSLEFVQYKNANGTRTLKASLHYVEERERKALRGAEIIFFGNGDQSLELCKVKTTLKGEALFIVSKEKPLPVDENGLIIVGAKFAGNDKFEAIEDQVSVKDLNFKLTPNVEDSVKTITIMAYAISDKGTPIPLADAAVMLYVQRMFSPLKIGEGKLDSTGVCVIDFPAGLPGDSAGNLKVIARIEENETYGNIQADTLIKWGVPSVHVVPGSYKALWSQVAPTWMVQTLIILLGGVWGHYAYAVYKIFKIRRMAKMDEYEKFGV
jgi:hypothetical protein